MDPVIKLNSIKSALFEVAQLSWDDKYMREANVIHKALQVARKEVLETEVIGPHVYCPMCELHPIDNMDDVNLYGSCAQCFC